jgi:tricorn protease-like protein
MTLKEQTAQLLGTEPTEYYAFAASPDGQAVAFDQAGKPWLYRWGAGAERFDTTFVLV